MHLVEKNNLKWRHSCTASQSLDYSLTGYTVKVFKGNRITHNERKQIKIDMTNFFSKHGYNK